LVSYLLSLPLCGQILPRTPPVIRLQLEFVENHGYSSVFPPLAAAQEGRPRALPDTLNHRGNTPFRVRESPFEDFESAAEDGVGAWECTAAHVAFLGHEDLIISRLLLDPRALEQVVFQAQAFAD